MFNQQLSERKANLLPDIVDQWDELNDVTRSKMSNISSFFCKMHIFVPMASEVDKCLNIFESNVCNGKNPFAFEWKESGASRLTRTITLYGCYKSGVEQHFLVHLEERAIKNQLITLRGHRFNHLFYAAGVTIICVKLGIFRQLGRPKRFVKKYFFRCERKGIYKWPTSLHFITGPFWRIIESSKCII